MTDLQYDKVMAEINALRGRPLYILFRRRNDKVKGGKIIEPKGTIRGMKCQFTGNNARVTEEDKIHRCITVWCLDKGGEGFKRIPIDPDHLMHFSEYDEKKHGKIPNVTVVNRADEKRQRPNVPNHRKSPRTRGQNSERA